MASVDALQEHYRLRYSMCVDRAWTQALSPLRCVHCIESVWLREAVEGYTQISMSKGVCGSLRPKRHRLKFVGLNVHPPQHAALCHLKERLHEGIGFERLKHQQAERHLHLAEAQGKMAQRQRTVPKKALPK